MLYIHLARMLYIHLAHILYIHLARILYIHLARMLSISISHVFSISISHVCSISISHVYALYPSRTYMLYIHLARICSIVYSHDHLPGTGNSETWRIRKIWSIYLSSGSPHQILLLNPFNRYLLYMAVILRYSVIEYTYESVLHVMQYNTICEWIMKDICQCKSG